MNASHPTPGENDQPSAVLKDAAYLSLTYSEARLPKTAYPFRLARHLMQKFFGKPGRLLDVGCGRGDFLDAFAALGYETAGVDISPAASALSGGREVAVADLESMQAPYPLASFEFVFCKSVLEHTRQPVVVLRRVWQMLKPGGLAIIMVPAWETGYRGAFYIDHTHVTPFTLPSLEDAVTLAGFEVAHSEYFYQLPFLWRWPALAPLRWLIAALPLPYRPMRKAKWPDGVNKLIWFSKEAMLLVVARRPLQS